MLEETSTTKQRYRKPITKVQVYRRENLRRLVAERGGQAVLGPILGYTNGSFLVQMCGPNPTTNVSENTARTYEKKLGLEPGTLDLPIANIPGETQALTRPRDQITSAQTQNELSISTTVKIVELVGTICETEGLNLSNSKFSLVIALTLAHTAQNGGEPQEDYIRSLLALAK